MSHTRLDDFSNPNNLIKLAKEVPGLPLCAAHMAKYDLKFFKSLNDLNLNNLFIDTSPLISMTTRYDIPVETIKYFELNDKANKIEQII